MIFESVSTIIILVNAMATITLWRTAPRNVRSWANRTCRDGGMTRPRELTATREPTKRATARNKGPATRRVSND
jgi:hypothetical protein